LFFVFLSVFVTWWLNSYDNSLIIGLNGYKKIDKCQLTVHDYQLNIKAPQDALVPWWGWGVGAGISKIKKPLKRPWSRLWGRGLWGSYFCPCLFEKIINYQL